MTPEQNTTRSPDELLVAQAKSRSDLNSMNTSNEERERLKRALARIKRDYIVNWEPNANFSADTVASLIADLEAQAARVKALEEGLKPFAEDGARIHADWPRRSPTGHPK